MKLLIYSHLFWPSVGGLETVVQALASGLAKLNDKTGAPLYEITVVTNTTGPPDGAEWQSSYRVVRKPQRAELRRLVESADLVHVAGVSIPAIRSALSAGKPVVVEHHGFQAICPTGQLLQEPQDVPCPGHFMNGNHAACLRCRNSGTFLSSLRLWLLTFWRRWLCERVTVNIVPTAWLGEQLNLSRVKTIWHGLPREAAFVRISSTGRIPQIVFMGRLVTTKGVGLLLEAAGKLREQNHRFEIVIIGAGPERESLEEQAKQKQLAGQVKFLGMMPNAELATQLAGASVIVVPSIGGEVFGMVVAENMLRGLPVLASDLGAFVEVLGSREQTFRTGDAVDLARKLEQVLKEPAMAADWGARGRNRILEVFSEERMIDEHHRLYQEAMGLNPRGA